MQVRTQSVNLHASVQACSSTLQFRRPNVIIHLKMQGHQKAHGQMLLASNTSQMQSGQNMRASEKRNLIRGMYYCAITCHVDVVQSSSATFTQQIYFGLYHHVK